ncbi:U-box domain-containing protein 52-like [Durio zibethinus]|uniref:U-box domain-containing protein 52-like n=1 Tax=Durio zibethinus TaxID=66656 RepID=A0A6P5WGY3_DURZI|nr:U-box domain-containing protein 52-like [Durio zibethinus]
MEETPAVTAIAIDSDRNSQLAVKWAVDNLLNTGSKCFLIHVRSQSLHTQDFEAAPKEGRPPSEAELKQFFLPYIGNCARKGIQSHKVVLHDIDVPSALVDYINDNNIGNIVVGASRRNVLTRKLRNPNVPTSLLKLAPESCTVYVISKGKVQISRLASRSQTSQDSKTAHKSRRVKAFLSKFTFDSPQIEVLSRATPNNFHASWPLAHSCSYRTVSSCKGRNYRTVSDRISDSFQVTPHDKLKTNNDVKSTKLSTGRQTPESLNRISISESSNFSGPPSCQSTDTSGHNSNCTAEDSSSLASLTPKGLDTEMRRLRQELKKSMEMFNLVNKEAVVAKEKARMLQAWKAAEERKLEEARLAEEAAMALAEAERQKAKAAMEAAHMARRLADMEAQKRKLAELKATREEEAKKRALDQLANNKAVYRKYTIDEIEAATNHFASANKIGEGGYGPVFKATLNHTDVAIKVLRPDISQGQRQFQQEVEVLSCMRHPHMVLLIGACPEYGCLVYEYMENGSLEDRLFRKNKTPSIPWKTRFRIAAEIATGLLFLHQTKPEPLVHRDLKPANILLDRNYVSKISDVGLSRLVPASFADSVTEYQLTEARGTFCYIDPEYQQSGMLGVKSDLYSFGVVLLQLITSMPPVGLTIHVQKAIEKGTFAEMLDPTVPDWPVEDALSLAKLALQCCELRKRDRPDLDSVVLPELNRLRDLAFEHEANNSEKFAYEACPRNSVPQIGSQENQITVRSGWQHFKSRTRIWKASILPSNGRPAGKSNKKPGHEVGCWSFINCSGAPQQLRRVKSFSS